MKVFLLTVLLVPYSAISFSKEVNYYDVISNEQGVSDINLICSDYGGDFAYELVTKPIELRGRHSFSNKTIVKKVVFSVDGPNLLAGVNTEVGRLKESPSLRAIENAKELCRKNLKDMKVEYPEVVIPKSSALVAKKLKYETFDSIEIVENIGNLSTCKGYTDDIGLHVENFDFTGTQSNLTGYRLFIRGEEVELFEVIRNPKVTCRNSKSILGGMIFSVINLGVHASLGTQKIIRNILGVD